MMRPTEAIYEKTPFQGSSYRTPEGKGPRWYFRLLPWIELCFYPWAFGRVVIDAIACSRGLYDGPRWVLGSLDIIECCEAMGMKFTVEGLDLPRSIDGPAVYVANHMSTLETFVLPSILRPLRPVTFVVKKSLIEYPVFGAVMSAIKPVAVGRDNPREDLSTVMREGRRVLESDTSIIIFPQTTRSEMFDPGKFNSIGAKLAARAGVPLVPLALTTDAWQNGKWFKDYGKVLVDRPVRFRFGEPIMPEGKGDEAHKASLAFITETLAQWGKLAIQP